MEPQARQSDGEELRRLVAQCLDLLETQGESAIAQLCRAHPAHESELRRRINGLRAVGLIESHGLSSEGAPERLGEFRLLRRLGGGGMGVVYLAWQEPLGREVALKLIRPEQLFFPGARERFRREIETIARLQHPGIVPVHTVGEEKGIPYFAMERVIGCTLADAIDVLRERDPATLSGSDLAQAILRCTPDEHEAGPTSGPSWAFTGSYVDACLHLIRQAAEALEHAHRRGILHRDIKPSNLMVTPGGRVMILDFGLASSSGTTKLTRTGVQIGSLAYMSPEQIEGDLDRLDARADVWALGVTLYELLALRSPFASESPEQTRRAIEAGHPPPLRTRQRAASWDVETVCGKAMEHDPVRRYACAADLARDLENVLEHRPIEARRAGAWLRARRWSERHPGRAVAIALGSLLVLGGPILYGVLQGRAREEIQAALDEARTQRGVASTSKERAEKNFGRALRAVRTMLTRLGEKTLENVPQVQTVRREILEDALGFYREFLAEKGDDPALQEELARVQGTIAELSELLGRADDSLEAHQVESQTNLALLEASPGDRHLQHLYASSLVRMAAFVQRQGRLDEAKAIFEDALERLEALIDEAPTDPRYLRQRAIVFASLGDMQHQLGKMEESEELLHRSLEDFGAVGAVGAAELDDGLRESWVWNNLAQGHRDQRRYDEAWEEHGQALSIREGLVEREPENADFRVALGQSQSNMGVLAQTIGREPESLELTRGALATFQALVIDYPDVPLYLHGVYAAAANLSATLNTPEQIEESERYSDIAFEAARSLQASHPDKPEYSNSLAGARLLRADNLATRGRWSDALAGVLEARAILEPSLASRPWDGNCRFQGISARLQHSKALFALGRDEEALDLVAEFPSGPITNEMACLREILTQLGACATRAQNDPSFSETDREARISTCMKFAADSLTRMRDRGFASWEMVWSLPELKPFQHRKEIPEGCQPSPDAAQ